METNFNCYPVILGTTRVGFVILGPICPFCDCSLILPTTKKLFSFDQTDGVRFPSNMLNDVLNE